MNRISAKYLSYESTSTLDEPSWFHPKRIDLMVHNNEFKIIKLRHKNVASRDKLLKDGTIFRLIIDKYLNT